MRCVTATAASPQSPFNETDQRWEPGAPLPSAWTLAGDDLLRSLSATDATLDAALIELVRPPDRLASLARELTLGHSPEPVHIPIEVPEVGGQRYEVELLALDASPPNTETTTVNPGTGLLHGIHLDNWDTLPIATRLQRSRRRLAINLGPGRRYLIFMVPDVLHISDQLQPGDQQHIPRTPDVREYARRHPETVTLHRLLLEPGDAYVGPTDLVAHDGSTEGIDQPSEIAFYLGRWPRGYYSSLLG